MTKNLLGTHVSKRLGVARNCGIPNQKDSKITAGGSNNSGLLNYFQPPVVWEHKALCYQTHWFLYLSTHPSINTF